MRVPPEGSFPRQFLLDVTIQRAPPPAFGAGAHQVPRNADDPGERQHRDKANGSPDPVLPRKKPKPA
jgi:hypothetical protein